MGDPIRNNTGARVPARTNEARTNEAASSEPTESEEVTRACAPFRQPTAEERRDAAAAELETRAREARENAPRRRRRSVSSQAPTNMSRDSSLLTPMPFADDIRAQFPAAPDGLVDLMSRELAPALPSEREVILQGIAELMSEDAVDKLRFTIDALNCIRARRNERRVARGRQPRELIDVDTVAIRNLLDKAMRVAVDKAIEAGIETVLVALFGAPAEERSMNDLHPDRSATRLEPRQEGERRIYLRGSIPF